MKFWELKGVSLSGMAPLTQWKGYLHPEAFVSPIWPLPENGGYYVSVLHHSMTVNFQS